MSDPTFLAGSSSRITPAMFTVARILDCLGAPGEHRMTQGGGVLVIDGTVTIDVEALYSRPMDAVRAIYRGLRLDPSPYQIEAAWKSVEVKRAAHE